MNESTQNQPGGLSPNFDLSKNITSKQAAEEQVLPDALEALQRADEAYKLRQTEEMRQLEYAATHDGMTGLLNKTAIDQKINQAMRDGKRFGLLVADLTNVKLVNDTKGHKAGDDIIIAAANILQSTLRKTDAIARSGGDEYEAVLTEDDAQDAVRFEVEIDLDARTDAGKSLTLEERIAAAKDRLSDKFSDWLSQSPEHKDLAVDIALGAAIWEEGMSAHELYRVAETSMYAQKAEQHEINGRYRG